LRFTFAGGKATVIYEHINRLTGNKPFPTGHDQAVAVRETAAD